MIRDLKTQVKSGVVCVPGNTCTARAQEDVLGRLLGMHGVLGPGR